LRGRPRAARPRPRAGRHRGTRLLAAQRAPHGRRGRPAGRTEPPAERLPAHARVRVRHGMGPRGVAGGELRRGDPGLPHGVRDRLGLAPAVAVLRPRPRAHALGPHRGGEPGVQPCHRGVRALRSRRHRPGIARLRGSLLPLGRGVRVARPARAGRDALPRRPHRRPELRPRRGGSRPAVADLRLTPGTRPSRSGDPSRGYTRRMPRRAMLPALVALLLAAPAAAQAPRDPEGLRAVLEAQFAAANAKDVDAYVVTLHQDSPYFYQEIRQFQEVIAPLGLTMRLESVNFTAFDGRHAYARAVQDVLGPEGSEHVDTRFDVLYVFRDDAGVWKTYLAVVLDSHPVPPTTGADQIPVD